VACHERQGVNGQLNRNSKDAEGATFQFLGLPGSALVGRLKVSAPGIPGYFDGIISIVRDYDKQGTARILGSIKADDVSLHLLHERGLTIP
jgi:hypothetical protein